MKYRFYSISQKNNPTYIGGGDYSSLGEAVEMGLEYSIHCGKTVQRIVDESGKQVWTLRDGIHCTQNLDREGK